MISGFGVVKVKLKVRGVRTYVRGGLEARVGGVRVVVGELAVQREGKVKAKFSSF